MGDDRVTWLIKVFGDLRQTDGVTTAKLRQHPELVRLLVGDPVLTAEAKAELTKIILDMGDGHVARAVRNVFAVSNGQDGVEARSGPEERRDWATGDGSHSRNKDELFIPRSKRTHTNLEKEGFLRLAQEVLDHADKRARKTPDEVDISPAVSPETEDSYLGSGKLLDVIRSDYRQWSRRKLTPARELLLGMKMLAVYFGVISLVWFTSIASKPQPTVLEGDIGGAYPPPSSVTLPFNAEIDSAKGWGPARELFTRYSPPSRPMFNSLTDAVIHGDERNFVQCRNKTYDAEDNAGGWEDKVQAYDGHIYECVIYFNNSINPKLDSVERVQTGSDLSAKLKNARARVEFTNNGTSDPSVVSVLSANNSGTVWDSCIFASALGPVTLAYIKGTARLELDREHLQEQPFSDDVVLAPNGTLLDEELYGYVGSGGGHIYFQLKVTLGR